MSRRHTQLPVKRVLVCARVAFHVCWPALGSLPRPVSRLVLEPAACFLSAFASSLACLWIHPRAHAGVLPARLPCGQGLLPLRRPLWPFCLLSVRLRAGLPWAAAVAPSCRVNGPRGAHGGPVPVLAWCLHARVVLAVPQWGVQRWSWLCVLAVLCRQSSGPGL